MADARYLVGPGGLRVEVIDLGQADLAYARRHHPDAQPGQAYFLVTRRGKLVAYCKDIEEVAEMIDLTGLRAPDDAEEETG